MSILALAQSDPILRTRDVCIHVERVKWCSTPDELVDRLSSLEVRGAVIDVDLWPTWATPMLARASRVFDTPVWLRLDPSPTNFEKLLSLVTLPSVTQVSLRAFEPGVSWLTEPLERPLSATIPALRDLRRVIPDPCGHLFIACVVFAERSSCETAVAAALAISPRELRRRLKKAGLPKFPSLMGTLFALHAAWRLSELAWNTKRAAAAAGFVSTKHFENRLRAHVRLTPRQLRANNGYRHILDQVQRWFCVDPSAPSAPTSGRSRGFAGRS